MTPARAATSAAARRAAVCTEDWDLGAATSTVKRVIAENSWVRSERAGIDRKGTRGAVIGFVDTGGGPSFLMNRG
ncbi:hypothetical protein GCM10009642_22780 [Nocardiopsis metallicus]